MNKALLLLPLMGKASTVLIKTGLTWRVRKPQQLEGEKKPGGGIDSLEREWVFIKHLVYAMLGSSYVFNHSSGTRGQYFCIYFTQ